MGSNAVLSDPVNKVRSLNDFISNKIERGRRQEAGGRRHNLNGDSNPNQIVSAFVFGGVLDPCSLRSQAVLAESSFPPASCPLPPAFFDKFILFEPY